jgi:hypothetical protein
VIRQQVGDLLEIEYEGKYYCVVVLTKRVMFGGNIVFAHHTNGQQQDPEEMIAHQKGYNVCTDLLLPKKEGVVARLHRHEDTLKFWLTRYVKSCHEHRLGRKAEFWFIYDIEDLSTEIARVQEMPRKYREAMDGGMSSFDLVAKEILNGYTPGQNPFLEPEKNGSGGFLRRLWGRD